MKKALRSIDWSCVSTACSLVMLAYIVGHILVDPVGFEPHLKKDSPDGAGPAEDLTVVFLVIGVALTAPVAWRCRERFPRRGVMLWVWMWLAASFYFAGEEVSWGQWWFGWDTPEFWESLNEQQETNLHNSSSWLNEKPRAAVAMFIFLAGFVGPLYRWLSGKRVFPERFGVWESWLIGPVGGIAPAFVFLVTRVASWFPQDQ